MLADNRGIAFREGARVYGHQVISRQGLDSVLPLDEYVYCTGAGGIVAAQSVANAQDDCIAHPLFSVDNFRISLLLGLFYPHFKAFSNNTLSPSYLIQPASWGPDSVRE